VQFVMSQISLSSKKESGKNKRKTEIPTYNVQTPRNISPQRSKFLFETSIHSSNSKKQSGLSGKGGTRISITSMVFLLPMNYSNLLKDST
jgi:hypothetical protein